MHINKNSRFPNSVKQVVEFGRMPKADMIGFVILFLELLLV